MKSLTLKPLHLPATPSWWPPAPGWWALAILVLIVVIIALWLLRRHQRQRQQQRWLTQQLDLASRDPEAANAIHRLLRRVLCHLYPSLKAADDMHWQAALTTLAAPINIDELLTLEAQRYQPVTAAKITPAKAQAQRLLSVAMRHPRRLQRRLDRLHETPPTPGARHE